jgi:hypothetical protein
VVFGAASVVCCLFVFGLLAAFWLCVVFILLRFFLLLLVFCLSLAGYGLLLFKPGSVVWFPLPSLACLMLGSG